MNPRFVTQKIHALIDYPVAITLIAVPFLLGLGRSHPMALWLAVATGVAALILTALTNHETGIVRLIPYEFHLAVDFMVAVVFAIAPITFGFTGIDALFYWANAAAVLMVVGLHRPASAQAKLARAAA